MFHLKSNTTWIDIHQSTTYNNGAPELLVTFAPGYKMQELDQKMNEIYHWVKQHQEQEAQLVKLLKDNPGLKELHDKFEMMRILCLKETNV